MPRASKVEQTNSSLLGSRACTQEFHIPLHGHRTYRVMLSIPDQRSVRSEMHDALAGADLSHGKRLLPVLVGENQNIMMCARGCCIKTARCGVVVAHSEYDELCSALSPLDWATRLSAFSILFYREDISFHSVKPSFVRSVSNCSALSSRKSMLCDPLPTMEG